MAYEQMIGSDHPGLFLILIDNSGSMRQMVNGTDKTKAEMAIDSVNRLIHELCLRCDKKGIISRRFYLGVIEYGKGVAETKLRGFIDEIEKKAEITYKIFESTTPDGEIVKMKKEIKTWIKCTLPESSWDTPMHEAFRTAKKIIEQWFTSKNSKALKGFDPNLSFPPIIINVSDGAPNEPYLQDTIKAANEILDMYSDDGNCLLMNIHIDPNVMGKESIILPSSIDDLGNQNAIDFQYRKFMFEISSIIPKNLLNIANQEFSKNAITPINENSRYFIYGANEDLLTRFFIYGTRPTGEKVN